MHDSEVPGAPTRILALDEGDEAAVPHEVEAVLRRPWREETWAQRRERVLQNFRDEFRAAADQRARDACMADYLVIHPDLEVALARVAGEVFREPLAPRNVTPLPPATDEVDDEDDCNGEAAPRRPRLVHFGDPVLAPPAGRPTVVALVVCVMALLAVECLLVALRVGGAIAWDWGWVLAPLWVPVSVATVLVTVLALVLGALEERDAARRRNHTVKGV